MESFEHLCKVSLEGEGFIVTGNQKFFVRRQTRRSSYDEYQTHGYEIDLVGARGDKLILAEVKSFFGSVGVSRQGFRGLADMTKRHHLERYKVINDDVLRKDIAHLAARQFGYRYDQIEWRLYVGKFARKQEAEIQKHLSMLCPPVRVIALPDIVSKIIALAGNKTYINDPVVMTVKALSEAGKLLDAGSGAETNPLAQ